MTGCAGLGLRENYAVLFLVGSKAYVKRRAEVGVVEPVFIKRINRVYPSPVSLRGVAAEINYVDTLNRVWMEDELTDEETATAVANAQRIRSRRFAEDLCLPPKPEGCR